MNLSQGSQQTISSITDLQTLEMKLYASLDNNKLTAEQRSLIIDKINQIAQFNNLSSNNNSSDGYN